MLSFFNDSSLNIMASLYYEASSLSTASENEVGRSESSIHWGAMLNITFSEQNRVGCFLYIQFLFV